MRYQAAVNMNSDPYKLMSTMDRRPITDCTHARGASRLD